MQREPNVTLDEKLNDHLQRYPAPAIADVMELLHVINAKLDALTTKAPADGEFLTVPQAAVFLQVSKQTIYRMKHLHVKRGRSIRLRRSTLDRGFREAS